VLIYYDPRRSPATIRTFLCPSRPSSGSLQSTQPHPRRARVRNFRSPFRNCFCHLGVPCMSHSKLLLIAALAVTASGFAQSGKSVPNVPKAKPQVAVGTPHFDLEDGDSADIPAFMKGKIDPDTYLNLRDQQIA